MSIKLMTAVWESSVGPATKRLVLLALADSANDEGVCWPSVVTIARKAGASRRRTEEVLAELAESGIVTKRQRFNESNVYTLHLDQLETPRESRGTPREEVGDPPAKSAGPPREEVGPNRKRTQKEPTTAAALAPELPLDLPEPSESRDEERPRTKTLNQRAVVLAQAHYERLGNMGNVPAFVKIIRKALEHDHPDDVVDRACAHIAEHNWTLTEERLANTLRGGPRRPSGPPPISARPVVRTGPNGTGPILEY